MSFTTELTLASLHYLLVLFLKRQSFQTLQSTMCSVGEGSMCMEGYVVLFTVEESHHG